MTVKRVLTGNVGCYRSHSWRDTCAELGIVHKRTRPYRPPWSMAGRSTMFYNSEAVRLAALPAWVHEYNHHRLSLGFVEVLRDVA